MLLDLCDLSEYVSSLKPMDPLILLHFAVQPETSAYEFADPSRIRSAKSAIKNVKWLVKQSKSMYRDAQNQTRKLTKLKLIEEVVGPQSSHKAKHYKLTTYGVYYIISKVHLTSVVLKNLLIHYSEHPLFQFFIYTWIRNDTLSKISADSTFFFSQLSTYLLYCLDVIKDTIDNLDLIQDNFVWEDIRTGSKDANALCKFLSKQFGWNWLHNVSIEKINGETIEIRGSGFDFVSIKLVNGKATVSYKDKRIAELHVSEYFFKQLVKQPRQLNEEYIKQFVKTHCGVIRQLVSSIIFDESLEPETTRILVRDKTFLKAMQDTKRRFEKRCDHFLKTS
jgi:hypothetical protein